jgi:nucleoside-diphosphate-sugar epimerase
VVVPDGETPDAHIRASNIEQEWVLDTSRIRDELGYSEVVSVEDGVHRTVDWLIEHKDDWHDADADYSDEDVLLAKYRG